MKLKIWPSELGYKVSNYESKKVNREIIQIIKNNNLSIGEAKTVFDEIIQELICTPIN